MPKYEVICSGLGRDVYHVTAESEQEAREKVERGDEWLPVSTETGDFEIDSVTEIEA